MTSVFLGCCPQIPQKVYTRLLDIDGDTEDLPSITRWWYVVVGSRDWLISHHTVLNHNDNVPDQQQWQQ